jgi:hypothetical protein
MNYNLATTLCQIEIGQHQSATISRTRLPNYHIRLILIVYRRKDVIKVESNTLLS